MALPGQALWEWKIKNVPLKLLKQKRVSRLKILDFSVGKPKFH